MPDHALSRCLAVVPLPDGRRAYVFAQLAAIPAEHRGRAERDESGRAWVVVA